VPPQVRGVGTAAASASTTATTISPGLPTGWQPGDIHVLAVESTGGDPFPPDLTLPADYALIDDGTDSNDIGLAVAWRRAEEGDTAPSVGVDLQIADPLITQILGVYDAVTTGSPIGAFSPVRLNASSTTATADGLTTPVDDCLVAFLLGGSNDSGVSGYSGTDPTFTEQAETLSTLGNDAVLAIATGVKATAGATGARTATLSAATQTAAMLLAILPAAAPPSGGPRPGSRSLLGVGR
jgi:hypothetical protein